MHKSFWFGGVVLAVMALAAPAQASNLTISLFNGTTTLTCADGAACDTAGATGVVSFNTVFGPNVTVSGLGAGSQSLGFFNMDLNYGIVNGIPGAAGTFTIRVSENNLSGSNLGWTGMINGNQAAGYTTAWSVFADTGNALFVNNTPLCSGGPVSTAGIAGVCNSSVIFSDTSFSLTESVVITTNGNVGVATGDFSITSVPEPGSMLLLGSGLIGLAGAVRRRLRK